MNNRKIYRHASPRRARAARIMGARARENIRARPGPWAHTHGAAVGNTRPRAADRRHKTPQDTARRSCETTETIGARERQPAAGTQKYAGGGRVTFGR